MSNKDDLKAIDTYVRLRSAPAPGAPAKVVNEWQRLRAKWISWYPGVISSWYVSDSDLAHGKAIRDALMRNQNPDAWEYVQETAADKPDRKEYTTRPEAPKPTSKPWEKKGLERSPAAVRALQERINAAGYSPPLKVDGKYGSATKAAEVWLANKKMVDAEDSAAKVAVAQIKADAGLPKGPPPTLKPKDEPKVTEALTSPPVRTILGYRVDPRTVAGAAIGAVGGFLAGGPVGAVLGAPAGFVGVGEALNLLRRQR